MLDQSAKTDLYNVVTMKNPLNEDFIFGYDNKGKTIVTVLPDGTKERFPNPDYDERGNYLIKANETRNFPKFIARTGIKHLIDKILLKKDPEGKLVNIASERDKVARLIFVKEDKFDRPIMPSDTQIVDQMNVPSDLDRVLQRNKDSQKASEPEAVAPAEERFDGLQEGTVPAPEVSATDPATNTDSAIADPNIKVTSGGTGEPVVETKLPTREKMVEYAKSTLKIDPETVMKTKGPNENKTIAQIWEGMTDQELYTELQIGEGDVSA